MANTAATATRTETVTFTADNGEVRSYDKTIVTLPVTLGGETRQIEFSKRAGANTGAYSKNICTGQIGNGAKTHRISITAWEKDGGWKLDLTGDVLGRQARAIGWADVTEVTSQHVGWDTTRK